MNPLLSREDNGKRDAMRRLRHLRLRLGAQFSLLWRADALSFAALLAAGTAHAGPAPESAADLGEIVVSVNRSPTSLAKVGASVTVISREELERGKQTYVKEVLDQVPGLSFTQNGPAGTTTTLQMRGAYAGYVLVRVDGIDISSPSAPQVAAALEHLLVGDVERIEILRGSQSALYGGTAVAGVIDISTRKAPKQGISQTAAVEGGAYGTVSGRYGISAANATSEVNVSAQRLHSDGFSAANARRGNRERDGYDNMTLSANGSTRISENLRLFAATRYTQRDIQFDDFIFGLGARDELPGKPRNHSQGQDFGARAGAEFTLLDARLKNTIAGQFYWTELETFGSNTSRFAGERRKFEYLGQWNPSEDWGLSFGADHNAEAATSAAGLNGSTDNSGVFGQLSWQPFKSLTLSAALRNDAHSRFGNHPTHRVTAAWEVVPGTKLRASQSSGFRPPSVFELFAASYGNPNLKPERSTSFDAGIDQTLWNDRASLSATWFTLRTRDLIGFAFDPAVGAHRYSQVEGESRRHGIELAGRLKAFDWLTLDADYTYVDARATGGAPLIRVPRHKMGMGATITPFERTTLSLRGTFVAHLRDRDYSIVLANFSSPVRTLPSYFLLDANLAYKVNDNLEAHLRGRNLLNRKYETVWGYGAPGAAVYAGLSGRF